VDDETAGDLASAFGDAMVQRMTHFNAHYFGGHALEDCFVSRYLSSVDLPQCFTSLCKQTSSLAEKHIQKEIGPPPTFVRISNFLNSSIASSIFRREVVSLLVHAHRTGHIYNGTDSMLLSLFVTSGGIHGFARILTRHASHAANDPVTTSIRYEDFLRQALHNLSNASELTISRAKHHRRYTPFCVTMQSVVFVDATSKGLWSAVDSPYSTIGRLDPSSGSRYGVCTLLLSLNQTVMA
tara:strand:- start:69 stop:785 length:717 start_codon:yes stop_codon:yes gene_type:complete